MLTLSPHRRAPPPDDLAPAAELPDGAPGCSDSHTSNGDSRAWQQSSRGHTTTEPTPDPAASSTDSHGSATFTSLMQKFQPSALLVTPSTHLAAEKSWPSKARVESMVAPSGARRTRGAGARQCGAQDAAA